MSPKPYNFIFKCITTFKAYRYSTEKINVAERILQNRKVADTNNPSICRWWGLRQEDYQESRSACTRK